MTMVTTHLVFVRALSPLVLLLLFNGQLLLNNEYSCTAIRLSDSKSKYLYFNEYLSDFIGRLSLFDVLTLSIIWLIGRYRREKS